MREPNKSQLQDLSVAPGGGAQSRRGRISRRVYWGIAALYLLVTVGATIYAQTGYIDRLPGVTITSIQDGRVPMDWLQYDEATGQYTLNTVEQQNGPWGKRYLIKPVTLINYMQDGEDTLFFFGATVVENPVVVSSTAESLHEGQEVRLRGRV